MNRTYYNSHANMASVPHQTNYNSSSPFGAPRPNFGPQPFNRFYSIGNLGPPVVFVPSNASDWKPPPPSNRPPVPPAFKYDETRQPYQAAASNERSPPPALSSTVFKSATSLSSNNNKNNNHQSNAMPAIKQRSALAAVASATSDSNSLKFNPKSTDRLMLQRMDYESVVNFLRDYKKLMKESSNEELPPENYSIQSFIASHMKQLLIYQMNLPNDNKWKSLPNQQIINILEANLHSNSMQESLSRLAEVKVSFQMNEDPETALNNYVEAFQETIHFLGKGNLPSESNLIYCFYQGLLPNNSSATSSSSESTLIPLYSANRQYIPSQQKEYLNLFPTGFIEGLQKTNKRLLKLTDHFQSVKEAIQDVRGCLSRLIRYDASLLKSLSEHTYWWKKNIAPDLAGNGDSMSSLTQSTYPSTLSSSSSLRNQKNKKVQDEDVVFLGNKNPVKDEDENDEDYKPNQGSNKKRKIMKGVPNKKGE
jgi:hypothetical protein